MRWERQGFSSLASDKIFTTTILPTYLPPTEKEKQGKCLYVNWCACNVRVVVLGELFFFVDSWVTDFIGLFKIMPKFGSGSLQTESPQKGMPYVESKMLVFLVRFNLKCHQLSENTDNSRILSYWLGLKRFSLFFLISRPFRSKMSFYANPNAEGWLIDFEKLSKFYSGTLQGMSLVNF